MTHTARPVLMWSQWWGHGAVREKRGKNRASTNLPSPLPGQTLRWLVARTAPNGPELASVEFYRDAAASIQSVGRLASCVVWAKRPIAVTSRDTTVLSCYVEAAVLCVIAAGWDVWISVCAVKLVTRPSAEIICYWYSRFHRCMYIRRNAVMFM
jgi:hypothetical protein